MRVRWAGWGVLGLALLAMGGAPNRSEAQIIGSSNQAGAGSSGAYTGPPNYGFPAGMVQPPQMPRQGTWAEVLNVSPAKGWIVLQDGDGRQYPLSVGDDTVGTFLIRWPATPESLGPGALVEVTGVNVGSNTVRADHADIYEGAAQKLVTPMAQTVIGAGHVLTPYDVDQMNTYGIRYFLPPGEEQIPDRTYVVGQAAAINPLQVAAGNNISVTVLPGLGGMTMSQITPGSIGLVRRGDLVYLLAEEALPRTLKLSQLIVYKKHPMPR